ncbi:acetyl-CoA carboxylase biotin carboxylase subunit [Planctomicrobium sp.]|jgi:acetyl-CoA carboxylase, biotin carboxylase subunit|nr:acetyl-CoA carboxylase biotin carboxylase subunit [Planctomicrobium sp.]MDA7504035.1 acetyl-CoA carboxylase biotin carboxylase subunit [bacterium]MDB4743356.1 acetyl-CoA carboxylase biotin carboxylase subunit [Planctomicrobium sp.]
MYQRILIANRGEIALRVIRACKEMGIGTVAVFSEADRGAHYLDLADEAICIGPASSTDSYLKIEHIIAAAELGEAQAVHPGYGFLAENADFAEQCRDSGIDFIGPPHEAMRQLGDKVEARTIAMAADVPVVPGSEGLIESHEEAVKVSNEIGYPILIKATAGGGGKGIRPAFDESMLKTELKAASAEAEKAFKNAGVYIEKFVQKPRHVEVQVIADQHGNAVHLWERDCTMQRKHQKLIEESPAPNLPLKIRESICEAATRLILNAGYYNAGTVEFIVDPDDNFYFIEVNARIQVEHPVTEMVTGIDLIQQQIRVAAGEKLSFKQSDIPCNGCSMEVRINAEDPDQNFRGCPGMIEDLRVPGGLGVRFDSHVYAGYMISPYYDSMIGKLIVHKPTREEAITCMLRALNEFYIDGPGIKTTIPLSKKILNHSVFRNAEGDTKFVERTW